MLLHKSPTYEPSSCELSKMRACVCMFNHKLVPVSGIHCEMCASSTSLLLLMILQLYHLSALLPPPVSNSSCLFTPCQLLCTSCCTISSVQSLSHVRLFTTPWTAAFQASPSFTISWSLLKLMSIESVMPSNHRILWCPLLLLPSIFPSIRVLQYSTLKSTVV